MAEFKRLSDVEVVETPMDTANVLIEEDGVIKKVAKGELETVLPDNILTYDKENPPAGVEDGVFTGGGGGKTFVLREQYVVNEELYAALGADVTENYPNIIYAPSSGNVLRITAVRLETVNNVDCYRLIGVRGSDECGVYCTVCATSSDATAVENNDMS